MIAQAERGLAVLRSLSSAEQDCLSPPCRQGNWTGCSPGAPKGREMIAQGEALGGEGPSHTSPSPFWERGLGVRVRSS